MYRYDCGNPAYNEKEVIKIAYDTISLILKENNISYEILFVNDGSTDETWKEIEKNMQYYGKYKRNKFF